MVFLHSLRLFKSNWFKTLKFFLYYIVVWGVCFALILPSYFEFRGIVVNNFAGADIGFFGVFSGTFGANLQNIINVCANTITDLFNANVGLAVYGILIVFVLLPFLINIGKYALSYTLYYYMTSNNQMGFLSALVKSLNRSIVFALFKTLYNLLFMAITFGVIYGLAQFDNSYFINHLLWFTIFVALILLFSFEQMSVLGWIPALIVFDCNVFRAYKKGIKAVRRHFGKTLLVATLYFAAFWAIFLIFGIWILTIIIPLMTIVLCVYNMTAFFTSQGMRFYINKTNIMTPKKLEEVDDINKTAYTL
ncbi:MAG: hypothetical protein IJ817_00675 [Clostridia bacterium]|nr:hypothetical protein [Clostridia bacterium]